MTALAPRQRLTQTLPTARREALRMIALTPRQRLAQTLPVLGARRSG